MSKKPSKGSAKSGAQHNQKGAKRRVSSGSENLGGSTHGWSRISSEKTHGDWRSALLGPENRLALVGSALLHLGIASLFVFNWQQEPDKPKPVPRHIQATLLNESQVAYLEEKKQDAERKRQAAIDEQKRKQRQAEEKRKKEQRLKEEQRRKKAEQALKVKKEKDRKEKERQEKLKREAQEKKQREKQLKEQQEKEKQAKLEQEREELEQKRRDREERLQQQLQALENQRLAEEQARIEQEQLSAAQAARLEFELSETERFSSLIEQKVKGLWDVPPGASSELVVYLRMRLAPSGELLSVDIEKSSGLKALDQSALVAARRVQKYPVPQDSELFEKVFRTFVVTMKPESEFQ